MKASELEKKIGKKKKTVSEIKQIMRTRSDKNPNFCLFLGAGASRNSGIRTASEMVAQWRKNVFQDLSGTVNDVPAEDMKKWLSENAPWYEQDREYACLIEEIYPLKTNRRKFIETEVAEKIPSIGYAYLVRVAEERLLQTIFTTNFDDLLNEAFYQFSSERALVCAHDSSIQTISITSRRTKIIKLHGDYLFDDLKNASSETQNLDRNMKEKLGEFLKEYGLIIAGFSGADKSITRTLQDLLDQNTYLQNGLFWCFRPDDDVLPETYNILQKPNSFYLLTSGFDELMADFYSILETEASPFNAKLASDRAADIIESYLSNAKLRNSNSPIIRRHLEALETDKHASLLSDLMQSLNSESIASAGISDKNLLVYLEIERSLKDRNPEVALCRIDEELSKTCERRFKEILLRRRFFCARRLNRLKEARESVKQILELESANFYMALNECAVIEERADRLEYLDRLKQQYPNSAPVLNQYAEEVIESINGCDKSRAGRRIEDAQTALKRSVELDPTLSNPAWSLQFTQYSKQGMGAKTKEVLAEIVDGHLRQGPYDVRTTSMLLRFCRKFKSSEYNGKPLFEYLESAYRNHFPRDYSSHLDVLVDSCIEFDMTKSLRPLFEEALENEDLKTDPEFASTLMNVFYDVFRDLPRAISCGEDFLRRNKKPSVEVQLINLYLENGQIDKAHDLHKKMKGAIELGRWLRVQADIFEYEARYQDAIDTIETLPDRRDFKERHTAQLSYLELKMNAPAKAVKRCKEFLEERAFALHYEAVIINYEYAKKMDGRNLTKDRIDSIGKETENELTKAVCNSLLERDKEALAIVESEAKRRFSKIDLCSRWPVLSRHQKQLKAIREELLKAKRTLTDFSML